MPGFISTWCCAAACWLSAGGALGSLLFQQAPITSLTKRSPVMLWRHFTLNTRLIPDHTLQKEMVVHELLCHTSNAGQGLCVQRCLGWLCRSWCWPWRHCCIRKALLRGWSTLWKAFRSQPSMSLMDAWVCLGSEVSFGCSKSSRDRAVCGNKKCFAPTSNGYSVIPITSPGLFHCCWLWTESFWLSQSETGQFASCMVGRRVYEQVVCLYDTVVV